MRVEFGDIVFDGAARRLTRRGVAIHLTPKAFELLHVLMTERPRAVSKDELRERLWPDVVVDEGNLKNLVAEIRSALGDSAAVISTVRRFGYSVLLTDDSASFTAARLIENDGAVHQLKQGDNVIGREAGCSVVIDFTGISRQHARIRITSDQNILEDLGSKNGTWRNGERVQESVRLADGDRIRFGARTLIFRSSQQAKDTTTIADR